MTREPWAEREATLLEFCSCLYVWNTRDDGTPERRGIHNRDPKCHLHGDNTEPSPY